MPEEKLSTVLNLLELLVEPLSRSLADAPIEDEELTPETMTALNLASDSLDRGESVSPRRDSARIRTVTEGAAPSRLTVAWSLDAQAELRAIDRQTALTSCTASTAISPPAIALRFLKVSVPSDH